MLHVKEGKWKSILEQLGLVTFPMPLFLLLFDGERENEEVKTFIILGVDSTLSFHLF